MEYVKLRKEGHVAVVTMSHEPINVLSFEMLEEMAQVFSQLEEDKDVWAVVLNSDQKLFAAGVDLKNLRSVDRQGNIDTANRIQKVFLQIENFPHPVICAVHGNCMGGGLELALSCDLRVFDAKVRAAFTECGLGICTGAGGSVRLTRLIGEGRAKRIIYTGELLSAASAYELGICEYVAEEGKVLEKALEVAQTICTKGPLGVATAKKSIVFAGSHGLLESLAFENEENSKLFDTEDRMEGINAFFEKRKAQFTGK